MTLQMNIFSENMDKIGKQLVMIKDLENSQF